MKGHYRYNDHINANTNGDCSMEIDQVTYDDAGEWRCSCQGFPNSYRNVATSWLTIKGNVNLEYT